MVKGARNLPWSLRAPPTALEVDLDTVTAREENEMQKDRCHTELLRCVIYNRVQMSLVTKQESQMQKTDMVTSRYAGKG